MIRFGKFIASAGVAALAALGIPAAHAGIVLGAAADFAVFGYGTLTTDRLSGPLTVNGNVGAGPGADLTLAGSGIAISGQIVFADPITSTNFHTSANGAMINGSAFDNTIAGGLGSGQLVQNNPEASNAQDDLIALYTATKGLGSTSGAPTNDLTSDFTWTGVGGRNVANLNSVNYGDGDVLTLTGGANDTFIFNITAGWTMNGTARMVLNGITADQVLFNLLETADGGKGNAVTGGGTLKGFGSILALDRNITFDTSPGSSWTGRLFSASGQTITLKSDANIIQPSGPVGGFVSRAPEPSTLALAFSALFPLGMIARRRFETSRRSARRSAAA